MRREFLKRAAALAACGLAVGSMLEGENATAQTLGEDDPDPRLSPLLARGPFPLPRGAHVLRDIAYGHYPRQRLDVYIPAGARNAPTILMVHGGGWRRGNKDGWRVVKNKATHFVGEGYVFVSINYRMVPVADPVKQADDVAKALAFVQAHLPSWGGDPDHLVLMGHSAGAHLVALLTAAPEIAARNGARPWLGSVSLDSGAMDVTQIMRAPGHFRLYDEAFGTDPSYWREASPTERLQAKPAAPILIVCSTRRRDSCPQGRAFAAKAKDFGGRAEVLPVDMTHAEINDLLGASGPYTQAVDAFLRSLGLP